MYENLFAMQSGNGWYLIVSESDWELYRTSYIQLIVTVLLSIALFAIVIILYLLAVKNQKRAEHALASKEVDSRIHDSCNVNQSLYEYLCDLPVGK